ncbi:MAG: DUF368 domain-containing protein [Flavobacteriaceae bacterium]
MENRSSKDNWLLVLKGIAMGAANKVPGVSGGIVALATNCYEELIYSLKRLDRRALKLFFSGRYNELKQYSNLPFLGKLFSGVIISYFSVSLLIDLGLKKYPIEIWSLFFGMILASVWSISKNLQGWGFSQLVVCSLGLLLGSSLCFQSPMLPNTNLYFVFFCGIISITGMTLPGLSGSFILLLLGNYKLLLVDTVNALFYGLLYCFQGSWQDAFTLDQWAYYKIMLVFGGGTIVGLSLFSNLLSYLLQHHKKSTLASILGFVVGSLPLVWPWKNLSALRPVIEQLYLPKKELLLPIMCILAGLISVLIIDYYGQSTSVRASGKRH